jgi:tetratricopeptide (TPR) repeat protein
LSRSAIVSLLILMVAMMGAPTLAHADGPVTLSGLVVIPYTPSDLEFEILLVTDGNLVVARQRVRAQDRFSFNRLPGGVYYLVAEVPGMKPVRQRVEFSNTQREISASIILEAENEAVVVRRANLDEKSVINVTQMAQPASVLKGFAEADKKLQEGNVDEARRRLETIVVAAPKYYDAHRALGAAYQRSRRYREAEQEYRIAMALLPQSAAPLINLGSLYLEQAGANPRPETLHQAREILQQAVRISPDAAFAHYLLGVTHYKLCLYSDAIRNLERALELEPKLQNARLAAANVHIRLQEWSAALRELDMYLKQNPNAPDREQILATHSQIEKGMALASVK